MLFRVLFHPRQFGPLLTSQYNYSYLKESKKKKTTKRGREGKGRAGDEMLILQWLYYGEGSEVRTEGWREPPPLQSGRSTDETGWKSEGWRAYLPFLESLTASPPPSVLLQDSSSSLSIIRPSVCPSVFFPDWSEGEGGEMYDQSAPSGRTQRQIIRLHFQNKARVTDKDWWSDGISRRKEVRVGELAAKMRRTRERR